MTRTRNLLIGLLAVASSGCTATGNFCDIYLPVEMNRPAATALVAEDRGAAERIATNEETYESCGG